MRFKGLDLNLLVALDVMLQEQSVTRAARRLNTTQSNVSGMLARLRAHFGDELLIPYGKSFRPSALSEKMQGQLHDTILQLEAIVSADGHFDPASSTRRFSVELPDHLNPVLLPRIARHMACHAPKLRLEFSLPQGDPAPLLYRGDLDLVITPRSYTSAEYTTQSLLRQNLVIVGWADNPALQDAVDTETLSKIPMITVRFDPKRVSHLFNHDQIRLLQGNGNLTLVAPTFSSIPRMLVGTDAFSFLHRSLAETFRESLPLAIHELPFHSPELEDVIMHHPNRAGDPGLRWLIEQFLLCARSVMAVGNP
jgi:LysR family nod box-dependent transcriptional activator